MVLKAFLVVALALLVGTCGERTSGSTSPFKSTVEWGRDFHLTDHNGQRVQALFVTVDSARDTPQALAKYVTGFHPRFLGLLGTDGETETLAREFKVSYAAQPTDSHEHYMVTHSNAIFVFDPGGRLRLPMGADRTIDAMAADIALRLKT